MCWKYKIHKNGRIPRPQKIPWLRLSSFPSLSIPRRWFDIVTAAAISFFLPLRPAFLFRFHPHRNFPHFLPRGKEKKDKAFSYDRQSRNTKNCLPQKYPTGLNYGRREKKEKSQRKRVFQTIVHWPFWPRHTISRTKKCVTYFFAAQLVERDEKEGRSRVEIISIMDGGKWEVTFICRLNRHCWRKKTLFFVKTVFVALGLPNKYFFSFFQLLRCVFVAHTERASFILTWFSQISLKIILFHFSLWPLTTPRSPSTPRPSASATSTRTGARICWQRTQPGSISTRWRIRQANSHKNILKSFKD